MNPTYCVRRQKWRRFLMEKSWITNQNQYTAQDANEKWQHGMDVQKHL